MSGSNDSARTGREGLSVKGVLGSFFLVLAALAVYHVVRVLVGGAGLEPLENSLSLLRLETAPWVLTGRSLSNRPSWITSARSSLSSTSCIPGATGSS